MVLDLLGLALGSFILALSGALVPGPMFSATVAGSHRRGFWFGPGAVLGHALAELPVVALLVLGLASFMENRWVLVGIGTVGAAALVWMGLGLLGQSRRPPDVEARGILRLGAIPTGFITSVVNPYWYLWWVTQPALLLAGAVAMGWPGVAAFFGGHISADLVWYSATSLGISRGRRLLEGRLYKALLIGCAGILFVMAVLFAKLALEKGFAAGSA
ncbi:MAG TPA: LysE family transporter [Phycisphaerae bacterium]|nr:LysE family transporter [Phycisphaerae bacterium]